MAEKCYLGFAGRTRSELSNEPTAEKLREIDHPSESVAYYSIYVSPDEIFGRHRSRPVWSTSPRRKLIRAALTYWDSVEAQRKADAVPVPKLSERAEAAVAALAVAPDDKARAALWRSATAVMALGPELRRFPDAVQQRLGEETVLAAVSRTVHILRRPRDRH